MATNEMKNRCGLSMDAASSLKWKKKMRLLASERRVPPWRRVNPLLLLPAVNAA
jgi:hypothetical protein